MDYIIRIINETKIKKAIVFGIAQLVILFLCIVELIVNSVNFELSYLIKISFAVLLGIISLLLWIKASLCKMDESCKNVERVKGNFIRDLKCLSREQRHDFMNAFQVIYGYLQLKKGDKAIEQINKITNMTTSISKIYGLSILSITLLLEKKIKEADNQGVEIICNFTNYIESEIRSIHNEKDIIMELTDVIDFLIYEMYEESCVRRIFIDISEYNDRLVIVFKGDINSVLMAKIQSTNEDAMINNEEIRLTFEYREIKNVITEDTIYFSLLNNE